MKFFVIFICLFNIVMWIVFLKKFKSLFTSEDIIASTKEKMERIISDMNRNVDRDITLVNDAISRLSSARNDAEKAMKLLNDMEKQSAALSSLKERISEKTSRITPYSARVEKAYEKHKGVVSFDKKNPAESSVVITPKGEEEVKNTPVQNTLFEENSEPLNTRAEVTVNADGASYAEIPVVVPEIYVPDTPVNASSKDDLKKRILNMYDMGYSPDDIVNELSCSMTEVQFVLTLENRI